MSFLGGLKKWTFLNLMEILINVSETNDMTPEVLVMLIKHRKSPVTSCDLLW